MSRKLCWLTCLTCLTCLPAWAQSSLPDPIRTPGAVDRRITQHNIHSSICRPGYTKTVRPAEYYTDALKRKQIQEFGYTDQRLSSYVEDHAVPLALGGAPTDPDNLWPEPIVSPDGWNADLKDELERKLQRLVCTGKVPLAEAQTAMSTNWHDAYNRYVIGK